MGGRSSTVSDWGLGSQNHQGKLFFFLLIWFQPRIPWHTKSKVRVWGLESQKTAHCIALPEQWVKDNIQDTHRQLCYKSQDLKQEGWVMWQEVGLGHSLHYVLNIYYLFTYGEDLRNDMNITRGTVRSRQGRETGR